MRRALKRPAHWEVAEASRDLVDAILMVGDAYPFEVSGRHEPPAWLRVLLPRAQRLGELWDRLDSAALPGPAHTLCILQEAWTSNKLTPQPIEIQIDTYSGQQAFVAS